MNTVTLYIIYSIQSSLVTSHGGFYQFCPLEKLWKNLYAKETLYRELLQSKGGIKGESIINSYYIKKVMSQLQTQYSLYVIQFKFSARWNYNICLVLTKIRNSHLCIFNVYNLIIQLLILYLLYGISKISQDTVKISQK